MSSTIQQDEKPARSTQPNLIQQTAPPAGTLREQLRADAVVVSLWDHPIPSSPRRHPRTTPASFTTITLERKATKTTLEQTKHHASQQQNITNAFRVNDLPKAALLLTKAYERLVMTDGIGIIGNKQRKSSVSKINSGERQSMSQLSESHPTIAPQIISYNRPARTSTIGGTQP